MYAAQATALAGSLLTYRLVSWRHGPGGLADYVLLRRGLILIGAAAVVGIPVGLPRLAGADRESRASAATSYLGAGLFIICLSCSAVAAALLSFPSQMAHLLFGDPSHTELMTPLAVTVFGFVVTMVTDAYLRAKLLTGRSALLLALNWGIYPPIAGAVAGVPLAAALTYLGGAWAGSAFAILLSARPRAAGSGARWLASVRPLARYGLSQSRGDIARFALVSIPALITAHVATRTDAAVVGFSISMTGMVARLFQPLNYVLLPQAGLLLRAGRRQYLARHVRRLLIASGLLSLVLTSALLWGAPHLMRVVLGPGYAQQVYILRIVCACYVPHGIYTAIHGAMHALYERPVDAYLAQGALAVFLAALYAGSLSWPFPVAAAGSFALSIVLLSAAGIGLTLARLRRGTTAGGHTDIPID